LTTAVHANRDEEQLQSSSKEIDIQLERFWCIFGLGAATEATKKRTLSILFNAIKTKGSEQICCSLFFLKEGDSRGKEIGIRRKKEGFNPRRFTFHQGGRAGILALDHYTGTCYTTVR